MLQEYSRQYFSCASGIFPLTIDASVNCGGLFLRHMSLGENLRALRDAADLTQEQLAQAADVQQSDISKWENDQTRPDLTSAIKLAKALKISLDLVVLGLDPSYDAIVRDLIRHASGKHSTLPTGGVDRDPATTRVQQRPEDHREEFSEALDHVIKRLVFIRGAIQKNRSIEGAETRTGRRGRKAR